MKWLVSLLALLLLGAARGDDVLFIGNSFTFAAEAPLIFINGGVPKLVEAIAVAKGHVLATKKITAAGVNWGFHLARPVTAKALAERPWTWVVLQDNSTEPTRVGNVAEFMRDGETFEDRIAAAAPQAGIVLYETWARPPGAFYEKSVVSGPWNPTEMMADLHASYAKLQDDLATRGPKREVRVAPVGMAFLRATAETKINVNAADAHHASPEGYYLAALVLYETIYHESAVGAPASFYNGEWIIPADDAAKLQEIADAVVKSTNVSLSKSILLSH